jgi:hypothetical protein
LRVIASLLSRVGSIHALNANYAHVRNSQVATCRLGGKTYATATLIHKLTFIFGLKPTWCRTD